VFGCPRNRGNFNRADANASDDNIQLVVRVVKATLESTNIAVATIIKDATHKQKRIESRVDVLKKEIAALESQVASRQREIVALEADLKETSIIKEGLALTEKDVDDDGDT
jgi:hypothetical protein